MARIIILNGAGSAGKSSIARALQEITDMPFLLVAMDAFIDMLPASYWGHPEGFVFEPASSPYGPAVAIRTGSVGARTLAGMRRAVAALAGAGNNLIVDEVMLCGEWEDYKLLLAGFDVSLVSVFAPLAVLEERERQRGDRMIGLARWQFDRVHQGLTYDLKVDTSKATPAECALKIKQAFGI